MSTPEDRPLEAVGTLKAKLGLLVGASVVVAALLAPIGDRAGLPVWLTLPVTVGVAVLVTQWLARGMTSPLRAMTEAATAMASGDYGVRVGSTSDDEVGRLSRAFDAMASTLAATDRRRRELVATVAHELRTPLTAQRALLENLADGVVQPDDAALGAALRQAERLSDLVTDLLDLSRIDAGVVPLRLAPVDVDTLLRSVVDENVGAGRDVAVEVVVEPGDLVVEADPLRLAQLVTNLLDNAVRHAPVGGHVQLAARATSTTWTVDVTDDGPGIPDDLHQRVLERFGTGPDSGGGTGLGLSIARWVCELHGGDLAVQPADRGAHLRATLPIAPPPATSDPDPDLRSTSVDTLTDLTSTSQADAPRANDPVDAALAHWWPEPELAPPVRLLAAALAVGVLAAATIPVEALGLAAFVVSLAVAAVVLAASRRRRDPWTLASVGVGVALTTFVVLRDSPWLGLLGVMAAGALLAVAVADARSAPALAGAVAAWAGSTVRGLPLLGRTIAATRRAPLWWPVLRTTVLVVAAIVLFGGLFASGDAVFGTWASSVVPDLAWGSVIARVFIGAFVAGTTLAGCYLALNPPPLLAQDLSLGRPAHNRWEWLVPLWTLVALFVGFLAAQSAALWGGHGYVRETTGLTYAEYVHQGFGQLTAVTALVLLVISVAARKAPRSDPRDRLLLRLTLGSLCVLTLAVVASALYRMDLYQEAYGYTVLRLVVDGFELWLGLVVLMTLVAVLRLSGTWLPRAVLMTGAAALLVLGILNPAAWVADRNLDRYAATGHLDTTYLASLGADAVPTIVDRLDPDLAACVLAGTNPLIRNDDVWSWNAARQRAERALATVPAPREDCPTVPSDPVSW